MLLELFPVERVRRALAAAALLLAAALTFAGSPQRASAASVVDASKAEAAYQLGARSAERAEREKAFNEARAGFEDAIKRFRDHVGSHKELSGQFHVYREAAYLYDRLVDCCFTQKDWQGMKRYLDGLLIVSISERNLCSGQLAGALDSGVAGPTAGYLKDRLDESVRYGKLVEIKRTLGLMLLDSGGQGSGAEAAIKQYQALAGILASVVSVEDGAYSIDVGALASSLKRIDAVIDGVESIGGIDELWEKYPVDGGQTDPSGLGEPPDAKTRPN
jgi:hypothetical protein